MDDQKPTLQQLDVFTSILASYRPSDDAVKTLNSTRTVYIMGPTASGKNTLISELLKTGYYYNVLSNTTRPRRMFGNRLEQDGEFYWHISEEEFIQGLKDGRYIEAAVIHGQQVSGGCIDEYEKAQSQNKIAITDVEVISGSPTIHEFNPHAHFVFILPPQFKEWMKRLQYRGAMTKEETTRRLNTAQQEISVALDRDYCAFVISGELQVNVQAVHSYVRDEAVMEVDQQTAKNHAEQLLADIRSYLELV